MDSVVSPAMVGLPESGRRFTMRGRVGLGDVDPTGRVRLDSLARYLQDVASADADDAQIGDTFAWVVRKVTIEVVGRLPRLAEAFELTTFCGGFGSRWAERRTQLVGPAGVGGEGVRVECAALWVSIDVLSGRPAPLTPAFYRVFGAAAGGRTVSARLSHPDPPNDAISFDWPLRRCDVDTLGHVNNAAHWQPMEEVLAGRTPSWAEIEFRESLTRDRAEAVATQRVVDDGRSVRSWLYNRDRIRSSAVVVLALG